ncbi:MAG: hypothetical protein MSH22_12730 [Spirochaetia bacterium]|nr:hypothetical protein [Spirochaetia bacterium]
MKKIASVLIFLFVTFIAFSESVPNGYGGVELGMTFEQVKKALRDNLDFGYRGERDVSLLPGENRILIETDTSTFAGFSYLDRCWFQFYNEKLYIITININREKMDHFSIFDSLCKKYGTPQSVSPEKSVWQSKTVTMSLERPLTLKYVDQKVFDELQNKSKVSPSGTEQTCEMFLKGL